MENQNEEWKPIKLPIDLSNRFEISNVGNLRRTGRINGRGVKTVIGHTPKPLKVFQPKRRYFVFRVKHEGRYYVLLIHRLVALQFIPNPENKPQINHIDANKHNNHFSNLEWVTQSENIRHAQSMGILPYAKPKIKVYKRKEDKLHKPPKKVTDISTGEIWLSLEELCKEKSLGIKNVRRQISGDRYCHSSYRYLGEENRVKFPPPPKPKKEKPPKKERPPRKVYVPHPIEHRKMIMYSVDGKELQIFDSSGKAAAFVNSNPETFRRAVKRSPNNFTKGYIWKYA